MSAGSMREFLDLDDRIEGRRQAFYEKDVLDILVILV